MYRIEMAEIDNEFVQCWKAAGIHLEKQAGGEINSWLRAHLMPPFLDHLSFRLGNQLFFIRIEDIDEQLATPGNPDGLLTLADGCNGHACIMPMKKSGGQWQPVESGWGLLDARTNEAINPPALITDGLIEMTDWELQDFAVQVVQTYLDREGREIMSVNSNPGVQPSLWFVGQDGPEWVCVSVVRYPLSEAPLPANLAKLQEGFNRSGYPGHFAPLAVASVNDPFDPMAASNGNYVPLYRGHGMHVRFEGLEPIASLHQ